MRLLLFEISIIVFLFFGRSNCTFIYPVCVKSPESFCGSGADFSKMDTESLTNAIFLSLKHLFCPLLISIQNVYAEFLCDYVNNVLIYFNMIQPEFVEISKAPQNYFDVLRSWIGVQPKRELIRIDPKTCESYKLFMIISAVVFMVFFLYCAKKIICCLWNVFEIKTNPEEKFLRNHLAQGDNLQTNCNCRFEL